MKLLVASDIHGSAHYCAQLLEACRREGDVYKRQVFHRTAKIERRPQGVLRKIIDSIKKNPALL